MPNTSGSISTVLGNSWVAWKQGPTVCPASVNKESSLLNTYSCRKKSAAGKSRLANGSGDALSHQCKLALFACCMARQRGKH